MTFLKFLIYVGNLLLLINVILFSIKISSRTKIFKLFWFYLIVMFIIQSLAIKDQLYKVNNLYLSHYYFIIQFILLSYFYRQLFAEIKKKRIVDVLFILVGIILSIQYIKNPSIYYKFNLLEIVLTSLSLVSFSVIHFYNSLTEKMEFIYVNSGIFIYLIGSTLIFCSGNFIGDSSISFKNILWILNSILYLVCQVFIFIEWYKKYKKR